MNVWGWGWSFIAVHLTGMQKAPGSIPSLALKKSEEINKRETGTVNEVRQNRMHLNMDFYFWSRYTSELMLALMLKAKKTIDLEINVSPWLLVVHSLKFKEIRPPAKNCNWHSCVLIAHIILSMYHSISQRQTNNNFSHGTLCQRKTKGW